MLWFAELGGIRNWYWRTPQYLPVHPHPVICPCWSRDQSLFTNLNILIFHRGEKRKLFFKLIKYICCCCIEVCFYKISRILEIKVQSLINWKFRLGTGYNFYLLGKFILPIFRIQTIFFYICLQIVIKYIILCIMIKFY